MGEKTLAQLNAELQHLKSLPRHKRMPLAEADVECDINILERARARRDAERKVMHAV